MFKNVIVRAKVLVKELDSFHHAISFEQLSYAFKIYFENLIKFSDFKLVSSFYKNFLPSASLEKKIPDSSTRNVAQIILLRIL